MRGKRRKLDVPREATRPLVCPKCGYNLFGTTSVICPECGAVLPKEKNPAINEEQERRMAAARVKVAEAYAKKRSQKTEDRSQKEDGAG
jgi:uncharacterized Zn finger protein (UPF0148 family)